MQFIERLFGLYPDGGSGMLELSLIAIVFSTIAARMVLRRSFHRDKTSANRQRS